MLLQLLQSFYMLNKLSHICRTCSRIKDVILKIKKIVNPCNHKTSSVRVYLRFAFKCCNSAQNDHHGLLLVRTLYYLLVLLNNQIHRTSLEILYHQLQSLSTITVI